MPITSLNILNNIVHLTRNLSLSILLNEHNTSVTKTLMRLMKKRGDPNIPNSDLIFTLEAQRFTTHPNTPDTYNISKTGDVLIGVYFPDIKDDQTVILRCGHQILDKFIPKKNKIYITLQDLLPLNIIEYPFTSFEYQIINNADNTIDTTQIVYGIYAFFDSNAREFLCRGINAKVRNITYENHVGTIYQNITDSISCDRDPISGYKINHSLNIIEKFFTHVRETLIKARKEHQAKWYYVLAELECMPDFGFEAIKAVDRLNATQLNATQHK